MGIAIEIVTPDTLVVKDEVEKIVCPGIAGEFGVLPNHVPLLTKLRVGEIRYVDSVTKAEHFLVVSGGYAEVAEDKVTVLADWCIRARDIDKVQEELNLKKSEDILKTADKTTPEYRDAKKTNELSKAMLALLEKVK
jgi:F-type H+-transporting ATPase subunit epsilon